MEIHDTHCSLEPFTQEFARPPVNTTADVSVRLERVLNAQQVGLASMTLCPAGDRIEGKITLGAWEVL